MFMSMKYEAVATHRIVAPDGSHIGNLMDDNTIEDLKGNRIGSRKTASFWTARKFLSKARSKKSKPSRKSSLLSR